MTFAVKKLSILSAFIAMGVVLGYALIAVPNVELVTATIFIAGFTLGIKEGLLVGLITETIYTLFNPIGVAMPSIMLGQVISMGLTGVLGGILGKHLFRHGIIYYILMGLAGLLSTILFAILTTIGYVISIDFTFKILLGSILSGLGFYITHMASNTIIFITVVPLLLRILPKGIHPNHTTAAGEAP
jgi:hypothetical protein